MKPLHKLLILVLCGNLPIWGTAQVMTVTGPIDAEEMGTTLIHEHVLVDWIGADSTGYHRWNRKEVVERALPYLMEAGRYGVDTFLDCTPAYLGRDPYVLRELSQRTGVHILTNTGYYGARNNKYLPKGAFESSAREIAEQWVFEFQKGIDGKGIRPGFLKMSVDGDSLLSPMHEKLIRAAALAHLETGLTIVSHTGPDAPAMAQLEILMEMGVAAEAFVWTHAQNGTMDGYIKAARLGAWISLDNFSPGPSQASNRRGGGQWFVDTLTELKQQGFLDHVLISQDSGWYNVGRPNGGEYRGYTALLSQLVPLLKDRGFTEGELRTLLVDNPKKAYTLGVRKL